MRKLYHIMGKSASGKDSIYKELGKRLPRLQKVVLYTTRPIREGEIDGDTYHFISETRLEELFAKGLVIEKRCYHTAYGDWFYATVDDYQFTKDRDFLMIGTLESFEALVNRYGRSKVLPIYIEVEDGIRLSRAIDRERLEPYPRYDEICRRFLADSRDFSTENLEKLEITKVFSNTDLENCVKEVHQFINQVGER